MRDILDRLSYDGDSERTYDEIIESVEKEEVSESTAADWVAENAARSYGDGEIGREVVEQYLNAAYEVSNGESLDSSFGDLEPSSLGSMSMISPPTPSRDRARSAINSQVNEEDLTDYDLVVAGGGSSYSIARQVAGDLPVTTAFEVEEPASENHFYTADYLLGEGEPVEVDANIEDEDVLVVTDLGLGDHDRDEVLNALEDNAGSVEKLVVNNVSAGNIRGDSVWIE